MLETNRKMHVYESDTIALPPIQLVLGEVPSPDPVQKRRPLSPRTPRSDLRIAVRRIIAHLENSR
jgi:hypothetical protein